MNPNLHRQHGAVAIMVAVSMLVLLAVVGLCVDAGLAYLVKARLNAAVDSAALAGGRAVTNGNNQTEQIASARAAAADFFAANIPSNYLLSSPRITSTTVTFNGGQATIDVRAEAPMPVSIMQIMNFTSLMPVAAAQTVRNDLDIAFVVDTSESLLGSASAVRSSAKSFLSKFNVTQDRVALIHFASGAEVDNPINPTLRGFNRTSMNNNISGYTFIGGTASVEGMWNARDQLNDVPLANRSTMRVIVFFSDGAPTAFGTYLKFNNTLDCRDAGTMDKAHGKFGLSKLDESRNEVPKEACRVFRNNAYAARTLPDYYNAHDADWKSAFDTKVREFPIVTRTPRSVTADFTNNYSRNIEMAARNLAESVAAKARDEGIYVFTLGMGAALKERNENDGDTGEMVLKCMANTVDAPARCQKPDERVGMYCYAATDADLTPCFSRLASAILRITK
ncbi:TadE/TadG family type IV pilus assembly protein [Massilia aurea]|uniref:TadE/TadG family type IV pilus assembly protein n=1 Tax=Massilia aurea TaxID=373040 RepID=UPI003461D79B